MIDKGCAEYTGEPLTDYERWTANSVAVYIRGQRDKRKYEGAKELLLGCTPDKVLISVDKFPDVRTINHDIDGRRGPFVIYDHSFVIREAKLSSVRVAISRCGLVRAVREQQMPFFDEGIAI